MAEPIYRIPDGETVHLKVTVAAGEVIDWGLKLYGLPDLWARCNYGRGVKVGVVDTGCPRQHDDLKGNTAGYEDFTGQGPDDRHGHSSHVGGIVGARQNDFGCVGGAPQVSLFFAKGLGDDGSGSSEALARGLRWCADQGCDFANVSAGGPQESAALSRAVEYAHGKGCVVIAAAGNAGSGRDTMIWPAKHPLAVAVGSHNVDGKLSSYSSWGPDVDVVAPGENVFSCYPPNKHATMSGTSMAAPFVTAVCALAVANARRLVPDFKLSFADCRRLLRATATDEGIAGPDTAWGAGRLDPGKFIDAVEQLARGGVTPPDRPPQPPPAGPYTDHTLRIYRDGRPEILTATKETAVLIPWAEILTLIQFVKSPSWDKAGEALDALQAVLAFARRHFTQGEAVSAQAADLDLDEAEAFVTGKMAGTQAAALDPDTLKILEPLAQALLRRLFAWLGARS